VRAEESAQALTAHSCERIDDGEVRPRKIHSHRDMMGVAIQALEGGGQGHRIPHDLPAGPVRQDLLIQLARMDPNDCESVGPISEDG
jgi:hypothetical protein